jgi:hypothetical protein
MNFESVSIVLPAMDETFSFKKTVDIILETCNPKDICELFIVLSPKSTPECVKTAESIRDTVKDIPVVIYYQQRLFYGVAIQEAFERVRGSHVISWCSDMETEPVMIERFIDISKLNPDKIVTASRWLKGGGFKGYHKLKIIWNFVAQRFLNVLFLRPYTDFTNGGHRLFPTKLVQSINWEERKHPFALECLLKPIRLGVKVIEIPTFWTCRIEGKSQNPFLLSNGKYFKTALHCRFMHKDTILKNSKHENNEKVKIIGG